MRIVRSSIKDTDLCSQIHSLASIAYPGETVLSTELLTTWHNSNPGIFWLAYIDSKLVGYISILPLRNSKFIEIFGPSFNEKTIQAKDILPFDQATKLFLSSIVVHPEYRGKKFLISRKLRARLIDDLIEMISQGFPFEQICGEAITSEGEKMLQSLGMTFQSETKPSSKLHVGILTIPTLSRVKDEFTAKFVA